LIGDGYGETFTYPPTVKLATLPAAASWITQLRQARAAEIT